MVYSDMHSHAGAWEREKHTVGIHVQAIPTYAERVHERNKRVHVLTTCPQRGHVILKGPQINLYSDKGSLFPPYRFEESLFFQILSNN